MKILAIRGKNLASLEGEFEIDFTAEPLKSSGIFAITGQTGAGKSTILDALCLALFDNAPRLNKAEQSVNVFDIGDKTITQKDSRNILRRGTSEGYAEVDFVALNGDCYRSKWMVRRARGRADGTLQNTTMTLHNLTLEVEEQGGKKDLLQRIVELIGLTFEQFTRAVLLAQGDFANFLKAKSNEKAELLEKLTGTEIFSRISVSIFEHTAEAKNALDVLLQRIKDIKLLSDEELLMLTEEKKLKTDELAPLKAQTTLMEKKLAWIKEEEQIKASLQEAQTELETIQGKIKEAQPRYVYMGMIEKSLEIRDTYINRMNKAGKAKTTDEEIVQHSKAFADAEKQQESIGVHLAKLKKEIKETEGAYLKLKPDINLAKELDIKIKASDAQQRAMGKEMTTYRNQLNDAEKSIATLKASRDKAEAEKAKSEQWFADSAAYQSLVTKVDLVDSLIKSASVAATQQKNAEDTYTTNKEMLKTTEVQLGLQQAEAERLNSILPSEVLNLRHKLIDGEPCPVCGSTHHTYRDTLEQAQSVKEEELEASKQKVAKRIEVLKQQVEQTKTAVTASETYIEQFKSQYTTAYTELREQMTAIPNWEELFAAGTLNRRVSEFAALWQAHKQTLESCTLALENISANMTATEKSKVPILENIATKEEGLRAEKTQQAQHLAQRRLLLEGKTVDEVEHNYANTLSAQTKQLEELTAQKEKIDTQTSSLKGRIEQMKKDAETYRDESNALSLQIKEWLDDDSHSIEWETLQELMKRSREWINSEKKELDGLLHKELTHKATLEERKNRHEKHLLAEYKPTEEEDKAQLSEALRLAAEQVEIVNKRLSEIEVALLSHEQAKVQLATIKTTLDEKTDRYETWAKLNDLLGSANGNKFKTIAQGYTLDVLLTYANKHLEELSPRYRLEKIPDTLALQVVDNDMLGEVRSVHSLSGGESFLISLALALGLSSLSSNRMKVESLFIDEGFGALDIETLSVAMDALDNLQTQGRKIGVISHVEEMKERISTQIQVIKAANGRSNVRVVG